MEVLAIYTRYITDSSFKLKDISFSLESDCITGFVGANGAGKTTTIKLILDLIKKDSGEIRYFNEGLDVSSNRVKNRIGFVLDDGHFYDCLSISEMKNVIAAAYSNWDEREFKRYLEKFRLDSVWQSKSS
jgi:ABC-2 type transport system ATP-binding protein